MIRTLFLGSNYEALETLKALHESPSFDIIGIITQPDKPFGRKKEIKMTVIKKYGLANNLKIIHTQGEEEKYTKIINELKPELAVCKSFGEIVPEIVLNYPKYGAINIHFSLLPKYRGAVPIQKAILDGEKETGISIIKMSKELDGGEILAQKKEVVLSTDTNETLRKRLITQVPKFLINVLEKWIKGEIEVQKQDEDLITYCWKKDISKENAKIEWEKYTANYIDCMVRAFLPWPVAWTTINDKKTKVFEVKVKNKETLKAGEFKSDNSNLFIGTKDGAISIKKLQVEGKKVMDIREFLNGTKVISIQ